MSDETLTLPENRDVVEVRGTVYTMAQKAQLPAFKVLDQGRFERVDIDQWIEEHTRSSQLGRRRLNAHASRVARRCGANAAYKDRP
jgi:hypothetical protein